MSFVARTLRPRRSKRPRISPASARCIASGLIRTSVRSAAIEGGTLRGSSARAAPPPARRVLEDPVADGEPEDGEEEQSEVADDQPVAGIKEVAHVVKRRNSPRAG